MSKTFKFENIKPIVVLTLICVVVAALLAAINTVTGPIISDRQNQAVKESLLLVMPDGEFENESDELRADAPETVKEVYTEKNGKGYVVILSTNKGYTGKNIGMTVAIGTDGKIIKAVITQNEESIVPADLKPGGSYGDAYKGADADTVADVVTGATVKYTEKAIKNALKDAFTYLDFAEPEPEEPALPRTDDEILSLAASFVGDTVSLTDVSLEGKDFAKRIYRENGGKGYVVYTLVISEHYGTPETETLVHIDMNGKIVKLEKLTWKVSDPMYGFVPPADDVVDAFYERFEGASAETVGSVELISGATNTSTGLRTAVAEAVEAVDELIEAEHFKKTEAELLAIADELVGGAVSFTNLTPADTSAVRRVYRENSGKGYVIFTQTISGYGAPDTEAAIHVSADGTVIKTKKLHWKVSDPMYGFVPPADDVVDAFYGRFDGTSAETVGSVELISGATNTSTVFRNSVTEALSVVKALIKIDNIKTDAQLVALAKEMVGEGSEFTNVTPSNSDPIRRVYRENNGLGYVVFTQTTSGYGAPDTAALIYIDAEGRIADVEKIYWKVSDPMYGFVPPADEAVDAFYGRFEGTDSATVGSVELISGATNTSTVFRNSVAEALSVVSELLSQENLQNGGNG